MGRNRGQTRAGSLGEETFALHCRVYRLTPEREYVFDPERKWRFDFAFPDEMVAVEVEGGLWQVGRHQRAGGFAADCIKYNRAAILGWKVLRYPTDVIVSGTAINEVRDVLHTKR